MLKRPVLYLIVIAVIAGLTTSCILDPKKTKEEDTTPVIEDFEDLTQQDHVLHNLQLAYNLRNIKEFERLLDDEFTFFFSEADYGTGDIPVSWTREVEIGANTNLFNPNYPGAYRATNIDLTLIYTEGEWTEIPQGDESWFSKEVEYNITVQTEGGTDYKGNRLKAEFIIREAIPEGETEKIWRIIRWRDIGEG
jgi:hypothetical protein